MVVVVDLNLVVVPQPQQQQRDGGKRGGRVAIESGRRCGAMRIAGKQQGRAAKNDVASEGRRLAADGHTKIFSSYRTHFFVSHTCCFTRGAPRHKCPSARPSIEAAILLNSSVFAADSLSTCPKYYFLHTDRMQYV